MSQAETEKAVATQTETVQTGGGMHKNFTLTVVAAGASAAAVETAATGFIVVIPEEVTVLSIKVYDGN